MSNLNAGAQRVLARAGIFALAVLWAASASAASPRLQNIQGHDYISANDTNQSAAPSPVTVVVTPSYGLERRVGQRAEPHQEIDKPFWLQWEFWTAFGTLGLAVGTIFLVLKTDGLVRSSDRTARRQLRAYVFPENVGVLDGSLANPVIEALVDVPGAFIVVKNSGQTPTYEFAHWSEARFLEIRDQDTGLVVPLIQKGYRFTLAPGATTTAIRRIPTKLTAQEIERLRAGTHAIFAYGRVEYEDAFGVPHWAEYRLSFNGDWPPPAGSSFAFSERGNNSDRDPHYK